MDLHSTKHVFGSRICGQGVHASSKLCKKCQQLFDEWSMATRGSISDPPFPYWENVTLFEAAAADGYHLCNLFLTQLPDSHLEEARRAFERDERTSTSHIPLQIQTIIVSAGCWNLRLDFSFMSSVDPSRYRHIWPDLLVGMKPILTPGPFDITDSPILHAKGWIERCRDTHPQCIPPNDTTEPTRLIAITEQGPRLVLSAGISNAVDYCTLSHCWGNLKILRLTKENLSALQERIPWDGFCKTFQDAYKVCQELGFKHLWIDSLCIVQDDPDDWNREALLMSKVYGGSALNIAASVAEDGSKGLWGKRSTISTTSLQICVKDERLAGARNAAYDGGETLCPLQSSPHDPLCSGILFNLAPRHCMNIPSQSHHWHSESGSFKNEFPPTELSIAPLSYSGNAADSGLVRHFLLISRPTLTERKAKICRKFFFS